VNDHNEVMGQQFRQRFVHKCRVGLAPQRIAKLPLDHAERAFDIRPLVVVAKVLFAVQTEQMEHLLEQTADAARGVVFEGRIQRATDFRHGIEVLKTSVCLVGTDFRDTEALGCCPDQRGQLRGIIRSLIEEFNGGDDVRPHAADDVDLHPHQASSSQRIERQEVLQALEALERGELVRVLAEADAGRLDTRDLEAALEQYERKHWMGRTFAALLGRKVS
jgi:hypothetical protein